MYQKIVNPKTNRKVSVNSKIGKSIIKSYYNALIVGGSMTWNNPMDDPEVPGTSERPDTPREPFSLKVKWFHLPAVKVPNINTHDTIETVTGAFLTLEKLNIADKMDKLKYIYYPWGEKGIAMPIKDPKKYTMSMLKAGPDSMIKIIMNLTGGNRRKRPRQ